MFSFQPLFVFVYLPPEKIRYGVLVFLQTSTSVVILTLKILKLLANVPLPCS